MNAARRNFVRGALMVPVGLYLFACGQTPAQVAQAVVNDIDVVAKALQAGLNDLGAAASVIVPTNTTVAGWIATIGGYVSDISGIAGKVAAGISSAAAQPLVQQAFSIFMTLLSAVTGVGGLPSSWVTMLGYAKAALTTVLSLLGVAVTPVTAAGALSADPVAELRAYAAAHG